MTEIANRLTRLAALSETEWMWPGLGLGSIAVQCSAGRQGPFRPVTGDFMFVNRRRALKDVWRCNDGDETCIKRDLMFDVVASCCWEKYLLGGWWRSAVGHPGMAWWWLTWRWNGIEQESRSGQVRVQQVSVSGERGRKESQLLDDEEVATRRAIRNCWAPTAKSYNTYCHMTREDEGWGSMNPSCWLARGWHYHVRELRGRLQLKRTFDSVSITKHLSFLWF